MHQLQMGAKEKKRRAGTGGEWRGRGVVEGSETGGKINGKLSIGSGS